MFIVEGTDYAGKTTVLKHARRLVRYSKWSRFHGHLVHEIQAWGRLPEGFDYLQSYLNACGGAQLCDRFVLSELAYGAVYRHGPHPKFTPHYRRLVSRELNRRGSVTILVKADWPTTMQRMEKRGPDEMMKGKTAYEELTNAFKWALHDLALGRDGTSYLGELDTSGDSRTEWTQKLRFTLDIWREHLERAASVQLIAPQSWGYLWPKIVLVGERVGGDGTGSFPFAGTSGCSETLSHLLDLAKVGERWIYLANAYDNRGKGLNPMLFAELRPKLVIALGKVASKYLRSIGVEHGELPHPQYIRRFESRRIEVWADKLRDWMSVIGGAPRVRTSSPVF